MSLAQDYKKYKWFFTSSGVLVIGGKSAEQNDSLLKELKESGKEHIVMHTSSPGSPFSVLLEDIKNVKKTDLEEAAIFTGCFSKAWKEGKNSAKVDIFLSSSLFKPKSAQQGTWGVKEKLSTRVVPLALVLANQKGKLRAVPKQSVLKKDILLEIRPGKMDKKLMIPKLQIELDFPFSSDDILSAIPAGGISISPLRKTTKQKKSNK